MRDTHGKSNSPEDMSQLEQWILNMYVVEKIIFTYQEYC